jgi:hypothetical protein
MAIAIRNSVPTVSAVGTATLSITLSGTTQPQAGDLLVIIHCNDFYALTNMPTPTVGGSTTGVTAITSADGGSNQGHVKAYYYVVTSTANLTVAVTETGSADEEKDLIVYVLSGADTTTPIDGSGAGATTTSSTSHTAPSVSPTATDSFLICHANSGSGTNVASYTPPSGMTEKYDTSNSGFMGVTGAIQQLSASGATGTKTFTASSPAPGVMVSFAIKTASTGTSKSDSDTATGTDNAGTVVQQYAGTETGTGTENAGTVVQKYTGTETGAGADSAGTVAATASSTETATGTDNAGTVVQKYTGTDTGTAVESSGSVASVTPQSGSDTVSGTDSAGAVSYTATGTETATGTDAGSLTSKTVADVDTATGVDSAGNVTQTRSGSDTGTGTDAESLTVYKTTTGETATGTEAHTNRSFAGESDNPTTVESQSVNNLLPQNKSDAETVGRVEGQTLYTPGTFSKIPVPKVWTNGDDLYAGTLNKEWRDAFNWLLRDTSPTYEGYNNGTPTLTSNVAIPITTDTVLGYGVTHASNDTKVYVWETGWYYVLVNLTMITGSVTANSGLSSVLKVNGLVATQGMTTNNLGTGSQTFGVQHLSSVYLNAGDYVEIAVAGTWTGTLTLADGTYTDINSTTLNLWWRSN